MLSIRVMDTQVYPFCQGNGKLKYTHKATMKTMLSARQENLI